MAVAVEELRSPQPVLTESPEFLPEEQEDMRVHNGDGEAPDVYAKENLALTHAIGKKLKYSLSKYQKVYKVTGEVLVATAVLGAISYKVYEMLREGKSNGEILDTFDTEHLNQAKPRFKFECKPKKNPQLFH